MFWNKKTIWNPTMVLMVVAGLVVGGGGSAKADFTFGTPTNLGPTVNSSDTDATQSISANGLSLYFGSIRPPGDLDNWELWVTTREKVSDPWPKLRSYEDV